MNHLHNFPSHQILALFTSTGEVPPPRDMHLPDPSLLQVEDEVHAAVTSSSHAHPSELTLKTCHDVCAHTIPTPVPSVLGLRQVTIHPTTAPSFLKQHPWVTGLP